MWSRAEYGMAHSCESGSRHRRWRHPPTRSSRHFRHRLSRKPWKVCRLHRRHLGYCQRCRTPVGWCENILCSRAVLCISFSFRCSPITYLGGGVSGSTCAFLVHCSSPTFVNDPSPPPLGQLAELPAYFCSCSSTSILTKERAGENTSASLTLLDSDSWS